jgi:glyoxylase-like metal-dependent hydrolase (beta-lactamase superfamily II)
MRLAAGLHQIGSNIVNVYLVEEAGAITLVDAGIPGQWRELLDELEVMGRSLDDVRAVLLTHGDTDHIGFAQKLHREHAVPVYVHELDMARARGQEKKAMTGWGPVKVRPLLGFLAYSARRGGLRVPPVADLETLAVGSTLDLPGSPHVIGMPGHMPGSVAYQFASLEAVCVGDAMTTRSVLTGAEGPRPAPFTLDQARADASFEELADLGARWVLPGHGPAWSDGVQEAARRYTAEAYPAADVMQARSTG